MMRLIQQASYNDIASQLSGVSNTQVVGPVLDDLLMALAQLDVHGRLIATWQPAKATVAFTLEQPVPESKVTASQAAALMKWHETFSRWLSTKSMLWLARLCVKYGGATRSQVQRLLSLLHPESPHPELLSEGGARFNNRVTERIIGARGMLVLSGEHGASSSAQGIVLGCHLRLCFVSSLVIDV